ncbi:hypothetical protein J4G33_04850 [Actinotalea sp. BY-33]|uniref:histidine kinase n=1 Tax=Actinotalea soli TaxID=2819234 RepID=A0A939LTP1_9CELL|nr:histidine kinase [Actinotalea soli]MBO1751127.1 hypothetical protein [Actinotalea soli]
MDGPVGWWRREARGTARRRVVSDAAVTFLVGVALLWLGMVGIWTSGPGPVENSWVHLAPLAVGCLVMLAKNRYPLGALAAGGLVLGVDAALGGSVGVLVVLIDLIYSAALRTGPAAFRRLTVGVGLTIGAAAVAGLVTERTVAGTVLFALQAFAVLGTPLWWGLTVRKQAELTALAEERAADLERLAELREREVLAEERTRMARDLHDAVAGNLSAIAIHAEAALTAAPAPSGRSSLEAIRAASVQSLQEMRSMIMLLRAAGPPGTTGTVGATGATGQAVPDDATSPPRLGEARSLLAAVAAQGLDLTHSGCSLDDLPELPAVVDQAAYRVLQEALTNAVKHGDGAGVEVTVEHDDEMLHLRITSTGGGGERGTGWGLVTMRERAEALGGSLEAGPVEVNGWVVDARLPLIASAGHPS